ncbi:MAG TPA: type II secretion system protein [Candidatus Angelobacter sp.]|nr:type II secretion system protein [Candidatus Angelobacter sp.]
MRPAISKRQQRGFTLIELIIVCAMISILLGVMVPIYKIHILHANEAVLKQDLRSMRDAIDQYTQDKQKAPQTLDDIVSAGYLHAIPKDPFTHDTNSWQTVQEDVMTAIDQTAPGITDVKSGSNLMSSEGNAYSSW